MQGRPRCLSLGLGREVELFLAVGMELHTVFIFVKVHFCVLWRGLQTLRFESCCLRNNCVLHVIIGRLPLGGNKTNKPYFVFNAISWSQPFHCDDIGLAFRLWTACLVLHGALPYRCETFQSYTHKYLNRPAQRSTHDDVQRQSCASRQGIWRQRVLAGVTLPVTQTVIMSCYRCLSLVRLYASPPAPLSYQSRDASDT